MREASISDTTKCYFVDDSYINCDAAVKFGWVNTVQKLEPGDPEPAMPVAKYHIKGLEELKVLFPELFKRHDALKPDLDGTIE